MAGDARGTHQGAQGCPGMSRLGSGGDPSQRREDRPVGAAAQGILMEEVTGDGDQPDGLFFLRG
jgi:hypothetical protein